MADKERGAGRGRRIHVEGTDPSWSRKPSRAPRPGTAVPQRQGQSGPPSDGEPGALGAEASRLRTEKNERETLERIAAVVRRVRRLESGLAALTVAENEQARVAVETAKHAAERERAARVQSLEGQHQEQRLRSSVEISRLVEELAPGLAAASWSEDWDTADSIPARHVRFGSTGADEATPAPAIVPVLGSAGLYLTGDRKQAEDLLVATLLRVVAQTPLKHLAITVFDPRARTVLGQFSGLRRAAEPTFPTPLSDPGTFSERLAAVANELPHSSELAAASGAGDLLEHWRRSPTPEGTLHLVVVMDYPYAVDERLQEQLVRLAATEGPARPTLLVLADETAVPAEGVDTAAVRGALRTLTGDGVSWTCQGYPSGLQVRADGPPPAELIAEVVRRSVERATSAQGPVIPLTGLIEDDLANPWRHDSSESLDVNLGRSGREPLSLSLRTANPPHPNVLVGGAVGQGKSNLLLDIIYGLAVRYGPDQLEFYLLDFKQGVEFKQFGPDAAGEHWLPHVRVLGLESNQAFGLAVLRHLEEELGRRSELFKQHASRDIGTFRQNTSESMSRIVLVVDEFHEMLGGDGPEADETVEILERIARTGRALGVHLVLASQTIAGVRGLAVKGDAIFGQFPLRLSLKNTAQESQTILSQGNTAAATLTYRGEVILNRNFGVAGGADDQRGIVAYADPTRMQEIQHGLWERAHGRAPLVFVGTERAPLPMDLLTAHAERAREAPGALLVWIGRPLAVSEQPRAHLLRRDTDQAVAVVGPNRVNASAAMWTMVATACPGLAGSEGAIVVLDGDGEESDELIADITTFARRHSVDVRRVHRDDVAQYLRDELSPRLAERGNDQRPLLVVGLSLQRIRDMEAEGAGAADDDLDFSLSERPTGRTVLRTLAREGALSSAFFVGNWNGLRTMEEDLGAYGAGWSVVVTAGLGLQDLRAIAGPQARPIDGSPRLGIVDRDGSGDLEVVVPYERVAASPEGFDR